MRRLQAIGAALRLRVCDLRRVRVRAAAVAVVRRRVTEEAGRSRVCVVVVVAHADVHVDRTASRASAGTARHTDILEGRNLLLVGAARVADVVEAAGDRHGGCPAVVRHGGVEVVQLEV